MVLVRLPRSPREDIAYPVAKLSPPVIAQDVGGDGEEPAGEAGATTEPGSAADDAQEDLLEEIPGGFCAVGLVDQIAEQPLLVALHELPKGVAVPRKMAGQEVFVRHPGCMRRPDRRRL